MAPEALLAEEIAAASPAGLAHVTSEGRWKPFEHLLKVDEYLLKVAAGEIERLIIEIPIRHGKLCAHETPVATTRGFVAHGDLKPEDMVFAPSGEPVPVIALGEEGEASWAVRFSDGEEIVTHGAHEWPVYERCKQRWRRMETQELAQRTLMSGDRPVFQVASPQPLEMRDSDLPMDPYTLGFWLGDGSTTKGAITYHPDDPPEIPYETSSTHVHATTGIITTYYNGLWGDLCAAGVAGDKHIPDHYLWASKASRWALLSGLIDSDGSVGGDGRVRFVNCNERLVRAVAHLVRSFGWRASLCRAEPALSTSGIQGRKPVWTVGFTPRDTRMPARLPRKRRMAASAGTQKRGIVSIARVAPRPGRCIQVPGGEYLVGEHLVPTHNSELVSHYYPAWWLGRKPSDQIMLCSYNDNFARAWGRKARDTLAEVGPRVFGVAVAEQPAAADWWFLAGHTGVMAAAGVGGAITGKGADLLIIDDPVKNAEEAASEVYRDKVWEWWSSTAKTRLQPGGKVVLVMARWHEDDLSGRIQSNQGSYEPWTVLRLPALAEEKDPMGRELGEALCPEMWPQHVLEGVKAENPYVFSALYQQSPAPAEGLIFKREDFRHWEPVQDDDAPLVYRLKGAEGERTRQVRASSCVIFQTADIAASKKDTADWTVITTWAATPGKDLILLDSERQHFETLHVAEFLARVNDKHDNPPLWFEIFGAGDVPFKQLALKGYPVRKLEIAQGTRNDKIARAASAIAAYGRHQIFHPQGGDFIAAFEEELAMFPTGHDDQVDTVSYAARLLPTVCVQQKVRQPKSTTITGNIASRRW